MIFEIISLISLVFVIFTILYFHLYMMKELSKNSKLPKTYDQYLLRESAKKMEKVKWIKQKKK